MVNREAPVLSWGRYHRYRHDIVVPASLTETVKAVAQADGPILALGKGRSYGDTCLNEGGTLIDTRRLDRFISFDRETGELICEPGVSLADILALVTRPLADGSYWFLPVTPGTKFVSVAGAIANDVHGKNHHRRGTFGNHVNWLDLVRGDGTIVRCAPGTNQELFNATIGGLGLTGFILRASIQLMRVPNLMLEVEDIRMDSLADYFRLEAETHHEWEYAASWVDVLAGGAATGRGIYTRARHAAFGPKVARPKPKRAASVPIDAPSWLLGSSSVRAFNGLYYRKLLGRRRVTRTDHFDPVFYPLDAIGDWNRLYGPKGFFQYQCVVPPERARDAVGSLLGCIAAAGQGSLLAVLKSFGSITSPGLISFPMEGTTLALDFPNRGERTLALLDQLDGITHAAGGRVYPAKDARMSAQMFRSNFPALRRFERSLDPKFSSSFWRRVKEAEKEQN
jgi:FAD/FMN-containing dehydrogenase